MAFVDWTEPANFLPVPIVVWGDTAPTINDFTIACVLGDGAVLEEIEGGAMATQLLAGLAVGDIDPDGLADDEAAHGGAAAGELVPDGSSASDAPAGGSGAPEAGGGARGQVLGDN